MFLRSGVFRSASPDAASVDVDVARPWWVRAAVIWSVLVTAVLNTFLPDLMAATGRRGTEFLLVAVIPLYAAAFAMGRRAWFGPLQRPVLLIVALLTASLAAGEHTTDGIVKVFVTVSTLAWTALLLGDRENLRVAARWGTAACLLVGGISLAGVSSLPRPSHLLALAALFARLLLAETDTRPRARTADVLIDLGLLGVVFLSTFRAATLAAALALAFAAREQKTARWTLVIAAFCALPLFMLTPAQEPSYSAAVARDDWRSRYGGIGDDRLSGRADIWANVWDDIADGPAWLLTGRGAGDVDIYVARVNPGFAARLIGDERGLHTHNTFLELLIATGVSSLVPMAWLLGLAASRARRRGAQVGVTAGVLVVSLSNVPLMDWTGGTLMMAVWAWAIARPEELDLWRPRSLRRLPPPARVAEAEAEAEAA